MSKELSKHMDEYVHVKASSLLSLLWFVLFLLAGGIMFRLTLTAGDLLASSNIPSSYKYFLIAFPILAVYSVVFLCGFFLNILFSDGEAVGRLSDEGFIYFLVSRSLIFGFVVLGGIGLSYSLSMPGSSLLPHFFVALGYIPFSIIALIGSAALSLMEVTK